MSLVRLLWSLGGGVWREEGLRDNYVWNPDTMLPDPKHINTQTPKPSKKSFHKVGFVAISEAGFLYLLFSPGQPP